jgi:SPP1 gp7 family putative phage head morphogenesis protein
MEKIIKLKPIKEKPEYYDAIEKKIIELFKKEFYAPLFGILLTKKIQNAPSSSLRKAILDGKIYYSENGFYGKFNAKLSKELQELGAKWDKKTNAYKISLEDLPYEIRGTISLSNAVFETKLDVMYANISKFDSEEFSKKLNVYKYFDKTLWKVEKDFQKSIENITVVPELTDEQREIISKDWQRNLQLYIKKFTDEQIFKLRDIVNQNVFEHGNRREVLIKHIQDTYNVTENKAKFLARQETNLLMAKYKQTKYEDAGVDEYEWRCVHMPHQPTPQSVYKPGEVRYSHGILEGKIFSWKNPPCTTAPGQAKRYNNPGQDYNCRCFAIPLVRFR